MSAGGGRTGAEGGAMPEETEEMPLAGSGMYCCCCLYCTTFVRDAIGFMSMYVALPFVLSLSVEIAVGGVA